MKLVAKSTLITGVALAAALTLLAFYRVERDRGQFVHDMRRDHRMAGRVLQSAVDEVWIDTAPGHAPLAMEHTRSLIDRANETNAVTRFEWLPATEGANESQRVEGTEFVSRFPVQVGDRIVGTIVVRESMAHIEQLVRSDIVVSVLGLGSIAVFGLLSSLVLGRWLVGRPISLLVAQARRIGRRELSSEVAFRRSDELGELALEMSAASQALAEALAKTAAEADARAKAIDQLRHSERLSTVGKLAAGIAHELGTPLSVVAGHAQMIAGREVTGDAALTSARAIDREVTRMGGIVRQLLDFARRKGPEGTSSAPAEVAARCVSLLSPMADAAGVRCEISVDGAPGRALIDEDSLQQVLTNVMVNGIQAMSSGGLLRVRVRQHEGGVRIDVSDTGPGIPEADRPFIFEPFFTTKRAGDGTGLGLAVVHGIVADHRGWVTVATGDRGTTFSLYFQEAQT